MLRIPSLALLLGLSTIACGSVEPASNDPQNAGPIAQDQFCAKYAQMACDILVPCCNAKDFPLSSSDCLTRFQTECQTDVLKPKEGTVYDAKNAGVCLAGISASITNCAQNHDASLKTAQSACTHLFVGAVPVGGSCSSTMPCAPSDSGVVTCVHSGSTTGVCTLAKEVPAGEACGTIAGGPTVTCVSTAYCKFDSATSKQTCVARAAAGETCDPLDYQSCLDGLTCDTTKVCATPHAPGETCNPMGSNPCNTGAFCDSTTKVCVAKKADGESCTGGLQCQSTKCSSGKCVADTIATADACLSKTTVTDPPPSTP